MAKNIEINISNGDNSYEVLYPKTLWNNVDGGQSYVDNQINAVNTSIEDKNFFDSVFTYMSSITNKNNGIDNCLPFNQDLFGFQFLTKLTESNANFNGPISIYNNKTKQKTNTNFSCYMNGAGVNSDSVIDVYWKNGILLINHIIKTNMNYNMNFSYTISNITGYMSAWSNGNELHNGFNLNKEVQYTSGNEWCIFVACLQTYNSKIPYPFTITI